MSSTFFANTLSSTSLTGAQDSSMITRNYRLVLNPSVFPRLGLITFKIGQHRKWLRVSSPLYPRVPLSTWCPNDSIVIREATPDLSTIFCSLQLSLSPSFSLSLSLSISSSSSLFSYHILIALEKEVKN